MYVEEVADVYVLHAELVHVAAHGAFAGGIVINLERKVWLLQFSVIEVITVFCNRKLSQFSVIEVITVFCNRMLLQFSIMEHLPLSFVLRI